MLKQNFYLIVFFVSQICGILSGTTSNESLIQPRIKGGVGAKISSAPFQVSIRFKAPENRAASSDVECGGSLISDNVVLTALHCVNKDGVINPSYWTVVMGNLDWAERNTNTLQFNIKTIVHSEPVLSFYPDIALLFLDGAVPKHHATVKPIILNSKPIASGTICHAFGWGDLEEGGEAPRLLQTVALPYISYETCLVESSYGNIIKEYMFCAGYFKGGPGACKGDSGGPLVCGGVLAGILSWGKGCGSPKHPDVLTNVAFFRTWITEQIKKNRGSPAKFAP